MATPLHHLQGVGPDRFPVLRGAGFGLPVIGIRVYNL